MRLFRCSTFVFLALYIFCFGQEEPSIPPNDGRVERAEYVSSLIKPGSIGAEIGVAHGVFAYHVLLQTQPSKLYLIDPWEYGLQADVELNPTHAKQLHRDKECQSTRH